MKDPSKTGARSPRGVDSGRPISVRLFPDERVAFAQAAADEGRALSNMARVLILEALRARQARNSNGTTAPEHPHAMNIARG
ncbi:MULTISPECIES: ribbon-helix-helix domain-containing protein [Burkholderia]|uniref:ribbon-helix-helix domain-containing protein n=1 Tax=Burkholderia TaxID=32008 RepID=UPI000E692478|nr:MULTISPECIES: hypothetical protein [Burkholderia]RIV57437.1 hypothetical protein D2W70_00350 [Burkholderia pseudomallei]RIV65483.1 hypothetical protein D2W49_04520 [Burkholderia pseudomallei]